MDSTDQSEVGYFRAATRVGSTVPPPGTALTDDVMNAIGAATNIAEEVEKRLYGLRDRLIGSPPEKGETAGNNQVQPGHFKGAFSARASSLIETLNTIDRVTMDLANRL